jgi:uncharacterized damage-inducible protein DinB
MSASDREAAIEVIRTTPARLREAVAALSDDQLATPYRPDGWTVRQLVHHVADSHMNAYLRHKLIATQDHPTIVTYDQDRWALLGDVEAVPIEVSLQMLDAVHQRWAAFLESLDSEEFDRTAYHPEIGEVKLSDMLALYAWHGPHHVRHITALREREGWD